MNANIFLEYIKARSAFEDALSNYYSHEAKELKEIYYPDLRNDFEFKKCNLYWGNLFVARFPAIFSKSIAIQDNNTKLQTYAINIQIMLNQQHIERRIPTENKTKLLSIAAEILEWYHSSQGFRRWFRTTCLLRAPIVLNHLLSDEELEDKLDKPKKDTNSLLQTLQLLPFRKMCFSSKLFLQQNDDKLIKSLKKNFGHDAVLVLGNWYAANVIFHEPIRNKGLIQMLKKRGFDLYLINEYKTSSLCSDCKGKLEKFKIVDNSRPSRRKDVSKVKCSGLLRCKDHSPTKLWNRDLATVCNFRNILTSLRETGKRPSCFRQTQPLPRPSLKRKQGENPSSNKRTKLSV
ncbi:hypothetical protein RMATCC62417_15014 [Rhizopus microsporus]|nr:hypothetical protein RMATCC62417_15014 [Rhizopus microsporus]